MESAPATPIAPPATHAWRRIEEAVRASVPAQRAPALLDEIRDALATELVALDWEELASENARLEHEMEVTASVDPLTGLRNRTRFFEDLRREVAAARRYDTPLSIVVVDVDDLHAVNEAQGYDAGDRLLLSIAELVLNRLRVTDIAARVGDDDFAVILPHTELDGAKTLADRITEALGDRIGVGIATLGADVTSGGELLQRADRDLAARR